MSRGYKKVRIVPYPSALFAVKHTSSSKRANPCVQWMGGYVRPSEPG